MIKNLLLTGANGFFGKSVQRQYRHAVKLGKAIQNDIVCDLSTEVPQFKQYFQVVVHAAGKVHSVPSTDQEKQSFFDVNVKGTENLLQGLSNLPSLPKSFVFISSVAVYGVHNGQNINENQPLNATDAYGLSKIEAERLIWQWCLKNKIKCAILRLPLIVGKNSRGNLRHMIEGIKKGYYFNIAGGSARRSMVLASDVAGIISLAAKIGGVYNLTDGHNPTFHELSNVISSQLKRKPVLSMPIYLAKILSRVGDFVPWLPLNSLGLKKLTSSLTFDDSMARMLLGWNPRNVIDHFKIE